MAPLAIGMLGGGSINIQNVADRGDLLNLIVALDFQVSPTTLKESSNGWRTEFRYRNRHLARQGELPSVDAPVDTLSNTSTHHVNTSFLLCIPESIKLGIQLCLSLRCSA